MALNIFKWFLQKSETEADTETGVSVPVADFLDNEIGTASLGIEYYIQKMAFWSIVRKIGAAVSAVEWETYRRGKNVKAKEYWAWNYSPNANQTRSEFFQHLIGQLYLKQEALVVEMRDGSRYVADSFSVEEQLTGNIYSNISVDGKPVPGVFRSSDVLHFTIEGDAIRKILLAITVSEGKLLKSATANYIRTQGRRGILKIDDVAEADPNFEETYGELVNDRFKKYFTAENAVLPLFNGYEYDEKESSGGSSKSNLVGTRDIRNLMDDIIDLTAQAFGVPSSVATGKGVTDADFKQFMTSLVQPLVSMIVSEINRKVYGRELVFAGTYVVANYAAVRYTDLFEIANPIDKLIGSGAFCINDIRVRLGLDTIEEPWAYQHWMTKNYSSVEDLLDGVEASEPANVPEEKEDENDEESDSDE